MQVREGSSLVYLSIASSPPHPRPWFTSTYSECRAAMGPLCTCLLEFV